MDDPLCPLLQLYVPASAPLAVAPSVAVGTRGCYRHTFTRTHCVRIAVGERNGGGYTIVDCVNFGNQIVVFLV